MTGRSFDRIEQLMRFAGFRQAALHRWHARHVWCVVRMHNGLIGAVHWRSVRFNDFVMASVLTKAEAQELASAARRLTLPEGKS